jgi:hypothetical protein
MPTPPDFTNGTALEASSLNSVGLWLVKSQTVGSGVSSVTVTDAFSASYDAYKITYTGGQASANVNLGTRLGATTTGYRMAMNGVTSVSGAVAAYDNNTNTTWIWTGGANTTYANYNIEVWQPFLARPTFVTSVLITNGADNYWVVRGSLADTTSYTSFAIIPSSGTLTGGTVCVYGYKK